MAYKATITSTTELSSTGSTSSNISGVLFVSANAAFKARTQEYTTFSEVRNDDYISSTSNSYQALLMAFKQPNCGVPILLGRRQIDDVTLTPTAAYDNTDYEFTIETYDSTTLETVDTYEVTIDSGDSATVTSIATALYTELATTLAAVNLTITDNSGSLTINPDSGYDILVSSLTKVEDTYTSTETPSELLTNILAENNNDWYFLTCEDHTEDFILAMADEIEATDSDDYPKQYRVCVSDVNSIVTLPSTAIDILGKLAEGEYTRTHGEWHHDADTIFPEVGAVALQSGKDVSTPWKFMVDETGVEAAQNPTTGKDLSTTQQGYLRARNASWVGEERGVSFMHGGTMAVGTSVWIDIVRGIDYINSEIETRLLNLLLNTSKGLSFTTADLNKIKACIEGVLSDAVDLSILSGYNDIVMPTSVSYTDQVARILDDVEWTANLAGNIHFVVVNGTLTYSDEELS